MTNLPTQPQAPATAGSKSPPPTVAAFDFDGTLTSGGSVLPFLVSLRGMWPVLRAVVALSPKLLRAALVGGTATDDTKEALFTRLLSGLPPSWSTTAPRPSPSTTWAATCAMTHVVACNGIRN